MPAGSVAGEEAWAAISPLGSGTRLPPFPNQVERDVVAGKGSKLV